MTFRAKNLLGQLGNEFEKAIGENSH